MKREEFIVAAIMEAAKKRIQKKKERIEPATEEGLANNIRESLVYPFVTGDEVSSVKNGPGMVTAHGTKTFVVRYKNGKKGLHDQVTSHRWTEDGLDREDTVQHLNEVSTDLLKRYVKKAEKAAGYYDTASDALRGAGADEKADEIKNKYYKHFMGATSAREKIADRKDESLNEVSNLLLKRYSVAAARRANLHNDNALNLAKASDKEMNRASRALDMGASKEYVQSLLDRSTSLSAAAYREKDRAMKHEQGLQDASEKITARLRNESVDELNEVSSDTLASYLKNAIRNKEEHDVAATRGLDLARLVGGEMRDKQIASAEKHHAKSEKRKQGLSSAIYHLAQKDLKEEKYPDQVVMTSGIRKDLGGGYMAKTRDGNYYKLSPKEIGNKLPNIKDRLDTTKHKFIGKDKVDLNLLKD